ncbi:hypothetical protein [Stenotrophomonas maltophilia]|uniref:hypothetical protein n=1 Tax=Stenotrophomonas maltophilia TaxID=40324 RepID=UPI0039C48BF8
MSTDDTTQPPQAQVRLLVNQHGLISGVRFTKQTPDVVFGDPEVVRIKPSGEVVIAEGANLDDAALAFWHAITEWRSTASRPTLADAQPGGRVRLGDALPPLPYPNYPVSKTGLQNNAYTASQMWDYARAALSAQPSPGGQDALHAAVSAIYFDDDSDYQGALWNVVRALDPVVAGLLERDPYAAYEATKPGNPALAARQPSKQPDSVALGEATEFCIEKGDRQPVGEPSTAPNQLTDGIAGSIMDLSQFRDALVWAEDAADCSSHPDHKAYRFAFTELLGMIDSQAVDNG